MREIAVYGKGGIGKSTISANLSAALALCSQRVLQIGCDPKHDSTRLLTRGVKQTTALDYMRVTNPTDYRLEDIFIRGFGGVGCVEAGGPTPGVGCAGRGIISTFELLKQFRLKDGYDYVLYDVLGDVVCGGFAVPIRKEYADTIFIVTSGEFMALYAANNILRGVRNYDGEESRVAGIIYNQRGIEDENGRVTRFAEAVGLPVRAAIPRSDAFTRAERAGMTIMEHQSDPKICGIFNALAQSLIAGLPLHRAQPLSDGELESTVLGAASHLPAPYQTTSAQLESTLLGAPRDHACQPPALQEQQPETALMIMSAEPCHPLSPQEQQPAPAPGYPAASGPTVSGSTDDTSDASYTSATSGNQYLSKNLIRSEPLHGCAFNGAMSVAVQIRDAVILAHSPKSCLYISYQTISSMGRRGLFERGALLPGSLSPNLACTEMGEAEVVFGGMEKLTDKIHELKARSPHAIIVVSACPAGIIGDDIDRARELAAPAMPVVTIKADGNMAGDYLQGMLMCYTSLARQIIKPNVPVIPNTVNIVFEKTAAKNTEANFSLIESFLSRCGVRVNCRFLCAADYEALANFCSAELNLVAYRDYTGKLLEDFFVRAYGCQFFDLAFPVGFAETEAWLRGIAAFFRCPQVAEEIIAANRARYNREIQALRPALAGKKLMVITFNYELDYILQTALDIGMEIVKIGLLNFSQDEGFRTRLTVPLPVEENYDRQNRLDDIARYKPDILLTHYESFATELVALVDTIPISPDVGFFAGLELASRWARLFKLNQKGEWQQDERLLNQYYA